MESPSTSIRAFSFQRRSDRWEESDAGVYQSCNIRVVERKAFYPTTPTKLFNRSLQDANSRASTGLLHPPDVKGNSTLLLPVGRTFHGGDGEWTSWQRSA